MRIEDLPPWAQAQAANQIMARQRRNNGRSRPPSPALSDDEEEMPRRAASKYHNRKAARITAAGNILEFDSQKEARRYDELALLLAALPVILPVFTSATAADDQKIHGSPPCIVSISP